MLDVKCTKIDIEETVMTNMNMSELTMRYYAACIEAMVIVVL